MKGHSKVKGPPSQTLSSSKGKRNEQSRGPPSQTLSRKEKRKLERKLKKSRKDAFAHRQFADAKKTIKDLDAEYEKQVEEQKKVQAKIQKRRDKNKKKILRKQEKRSEKKAAQAVVDQEELELKRLEKKLKIKKVKGKASLPRAFIMDGLDYLIDATESDRIKEFDDVGLGMPIVSDSESESEESDMDDAAEDQESTNPDYKSPDVVSTWDPDNKAGKSILKKVKKKDEKHVTFVGAKEESQESDSNSDDDVLGLDDDGDVGDDDEENYGNFDEEESDDESDEDNLGKELGIGNIPKSLEEGFDPVENTHHGEDSSSKKRKRTEDTEELKEDIYGRVRDEEGNIVKSAYIPPAKRAMMAGSKPNEALHKALKGLINRVSEGTMHSLCNQVESLYLENSRADVNEAFCGLVMDAVIGPVLAPERLVAELAMLVAILHSNVGSEVGAFFLQKLAVKFTEFSELPDYGVGKKIDNVLMLISNLYNFKVVSSALMIDIMGKLIKTFGVRDIELLLLLFKTIGFTLRKDDPAQLKTVILNVQEKARESHVATDAGMEFRVKFMLDILTALRNNNMRKIPGYDSTHLEHLRRLVKSFLRGQMLGDNVLTIALDDLLKADQFGRWWIVGSAWEGRAAKEDNKEDKEAETKMKELSGASEKLLKIAKQQGMNTDVRRHIFCILGTSEDFEDAFARLLRLGLNKTQEREIIYVIFHCCLKEKAYNPYYGHLTEKFCTFDRRFMMTVKFTIWDQFKEVNKMEKETRIKLGHLLCHLIISKSLSLSVLKAVEFGLESKKMIRLLVQVLSEVLGSPNLEVLTEIFARIAPVAKLKGLCQGLQVFMRVHLKGVVIKGLSEEASLDRIERAESAMFSRQSMML